jgi:tartrate-resistant acid phosphatase type 5
MGSVPLVRSPLLCAGALVIVSSACASTPEVAVVASKQVAIPGRGPDEHAPRVRFVAFGDGGYGGEDALRVTSAAAQACAGDCDFAVLLGDNVYSSGVAHVDDPQWDEKLEGPLRVLGIPVYAVLGNHDYGTGGLGIDPRRAEAAIARAARSDVVRMPAHVYRVIAGPAELVFFDTQPAYLSDGPLAALVGVDDDARAIDRELAMLELQSARRWRIALAHHPYRSNGVHGDAGRYDFAPLDGWPLAGGSVKALLDRRVMGRFALYLSGHDHDLMDMGDERGTALVVSGSASDTRPLMNQRVVPFAAEAFGFVIIEVTERALQIEIFTVDDATHSTPGAWRRAHVRTLAGPP